MRARMTERILIPRWALTVMYGVFVLLGHAVLWASAPSLDEVSPDWYTPVWAMLVSLAGAVALVGSVRPRREPLERWAVAGLASLMLVFALAPIWLVIQGDSDRASYSVVALALSGLPIARTIQLIPRAGTKNE